MIRSKHGRLMKLFATVLIVSSLSGCTSCPAPQGSVSAYNLRQVHLTLPKDAKDIQPRKTLEDIDYNNQAIAKAKKNGR